MKGNGGRLLALLVAVLLVGSVAPVADTPSNLGVVDTIEYDDQIDLDASAGHQLTTGELDNDTLDELVSRAKARIEIIRGLEFTEPVSVDVITREEYESPGQPWSDDDRTWENIKWQALFVIGQDRDATEVLDTTLEAGVQGYYTPDNGEIVLVTEDETEPIDKGTLIHELVHALQHQHFGLGTDTATTDGIMGYDGVVEGEAELIPELYLDRCQRSWSCIVPEQSERPPLDLERGVRLSLLTPYRAGSDFVTEIQQRDGWDGVDGLHEQPPQSSTELIHIDPYPFEPRSVSVPDRSNASWDRLTPTERDTLGEASMYAMVAHNEIIDSEETDYTHGYTTGWAGDTLVPYEYNGAVGYVWKTAWEDATEADQFAFAYRELLTEVGGVEFAPDRYMVPDGPFAGGYELRNAGDEVHIVFGPSTADIPEIHERAAS